MTDLNHWTNYTVICVGRADQDRSAEPSRLEEKWILVGFHASSAISKGNAETSNQTVLGHSEEASLVKRWSYFVYGVVSHALFFAVFFYMAGFVANLVVPKTIDSPASESFGSAVLIDLSLIALFALQHSVMARPAFKQVWTRFVPEPNAMKLRCNLGTE